MEEMCRQENDKIVKEEVNFSQTGLLDTEPAADGTVNDKAATSGVKLQYHEPKDSADSTDLWRLYVFKNGETIGAFFYSWSECLLVCYE